jgi:hypothetical protein
VGNGTPSPAIPKQVSGRAPSAVPRRTISASPRASSALLAFEPRPSPSTMPAASATTFFAAPAISTPTTSWFV